MSATPFGVLLMDYEYSRPCLPCIAVLLCFKINVHFFVEHSKFDCITILEC